MSAHNSIEKRKKVTHKDDIPKSILVMSVGNPVNLAYSTQEQRIAKEPTLITLAQANHINPETKNAPLVKLVKRIIPNH